MNEPIIIGRTIASGRYGLLAVLVWRFMAFFIADLLVFFFSRDRGEENKGEKTVTEFGLSGIDVVTVTSSLTLNCYWSAAGVKSSIYFV